MENTEALNYTAAFEELQSIIGEIENEEIDVDVLAEKVKRASFLISFCKEKLTTTEEDVKAVLKDLDKKQAPLETENDVD